jgi:uncharacterized phage protein (TIGR02218 family)
MTFVEKEVTTIAFCWRLERCDGVALGFTTHDRDLEIGGLLYRARPGMLPSAVAVSDGFDASALDVAGALTADAISAADLEAGRWDGAAVALFIVDWEDPGDASLPLVRGELGSVSSKGDAFEAELRGPAALLERAVVEQTSPECRAELGDKRCRVDMAPRTHITRVVGIAGETALDVAADTGAADAFAYGRLRWLTGPNSGLESAIAGSAGARVTLRDPPVRAPAAGELVELCEGCDKSFATCRDRFGNALNFRGEPHLPGMDLLTRYPGAS